jgi:hypothetical protein
MKDKEEKIKGKTPPKETRRAVRRRPQAHTPRGSRRIHRKNGYSFTLFRCGRGYVKIPGCVLLYDDIGNPVAWLPGSEKKPRGMRVAP